MSQFCMSCQNLEVTLTVTACLLLSSLRTELDVVPLNHFA